jgi:hypothetical protein
MCAICMSPSTQVAKHVHIRMLQAIRHCYVSPGNGSAILLVAASSSVLLSVLNMRVVAASAFMYLKALSNTIALVSVTVTLSTIQQFNRARRNARIKGTGVLALMTTQFCGLAYCVYEVWSWVSNCLHIYYIYEIQC